MVKEEKTGHRVNWSRKEKADDSEQGWKELRVSLLCGRLGESSYQSPKICQA